MYARHVRLLWWWRFLNGFDRPSISIESENTVVAVQYYYYCTVLHIFICMFYFCFSFNITLLYVVFHAYAGSVPKVLMWVDAVSMCHQKYFPFLYSARFLYFTWRIFCLYRLFLLFMVYLHRILCHATQMREREEEEEGEGKGKQTSDCAKM